MKEKNLLNLFRVNQESCQEPIGCVLYISPTSEDFVESVNIGVAILEVTPSRRVNINTFFRDRDIRPLALNIDIMDNNLNVVVVIAWTTGHHKQLGLWYIAMVYTC